MQPGRVRRLVIDSPLNLPVPVPPIARSFVHAFKLRLKRMDELWRHPVELVLRLLCQFWLAVVERVHGLGSC